MIGDISTGRITRQITIAVIFYGICFKISFNDQRGNLNCFHSILFNTSFLFIEAYVIWLQDFTSQLFGLTLLLGSILVNMAGLIIEHPSWRITLRTPGMYWPNRTVANKPWDSACGMSEEWRRKTTAWHQRLIRVILRRLFGQVKFNMTVYMWSVNIVVWISVPPFTDMD